jgi:ABC-type Zn uptake system ZnuABC Zn-binding protein ZnuA
MFPVTRCIRVAVFAALFLFPPPEATAARTELAILATTFPVWIFTRNVVRDCPNTRVELLVPAGSGCPHDYTLTPRDRQKLASADVIVLNGLGLDDFLRDALPAAGDKTVEAGAELADASGRAGSTGHDGGERGQHTHEGGNPHQFSSPARAAVMTRTICEALAGRDPDNAETYRRAAEDYILRLAALARQLEKIKNRTRGRGVVVQHDSLSALCEDAGLEQIAVVEEDGQTPSTADLVGLIGLIRSRRSAVLACDPQYPDKIMAMLSKECGMPCINLNPAAAGPADAPLDWYESVMQANIKTLERHFGRP